MLNTDSAWGLPVDNLFTTARITCQYISTRCVYTPLSTVSTRGKSWIIRMFSEVFQVGFTHPKSAVSYLLKTHVIHISTLPITTTNKKGFKK